MGQEIKIHTADVVRSGQGHWLGSSMLDHHNLVRAVSQIPWVKMGTSHIFAYFNPAQVAPGLLFNCFPSLASLFLLHVFVLLHLILFSAWSNCLLSLFCCIQLDDVWWHKMVSLSHTHFFFSWDSDIHWSNWFPHSVCDLDDHIRKVHESLGASFAWKRVVP